MTTKISGANISSIGNTGLNWQAVTVADGSTQVNATSGNGYLLDTNAGVIEAFLPTSPSRGDTVVIADYSGTFATNRCIVNTGGINIDSTVGSDFQLTTNNTIAEFVYIDAAKGWLVKLNQAAGTTPSGIDNAFGGYDTLPPGYPFISATGGTITTSGDYKIHTFTGDGCFVVSYAGTGTCAAPSVVDYLVVAGGASGANGEVSGGGGGAGGFREAKAATSPTHTASPHTVSPLADTSGITVTTTTYPITVGGGGAAIDPVPGPSGLIAGNDGSPSIFSTITSAGGGGGGAVPNPAGGQIARTGGSGGGGYGNSQPGTGGAGNTPPTSPPQGNNGGNAQNPPSWANTGGGGGATSAGESKTSSYGPTGGAGGNGGAGATTSISGSPTAYAGGGGGSSDTRNGNPGAPSGAGGTGGGGAGANGASTAGSGTANRGGGGGGGNGPANGGNPTASGAGGKGIVIIRYKFQ